MSGAPGMVRRRLGELLFDRVAGPEGAANRARFAAPGPRWFDADRPIRRVQGDAAMFVGGLRALLLQSLHDPPVLVLDEATSALDTQTELLARGGRYAALVSRDAGLNAGLNADLAVDLAGAAA